MNSLDNQKYYTLLSAAYAVCMDLGEDDSRVEQYLHYAYDACRELHFDYSHEVKSVILKMKGWKQIDFPHDMVDWVKVGFKCGNSLKLLTQDPNIPKYFTKGEDCTLLPNEDCPDIDAAETFPSIVPFYTYQGEPWAGEVPKYYGSLVTYNYVGYFDVDWRNRVINFKKTISQDNEIYIEYITDGINYSGATVVHPYAWRTLKLFIHWQRKLHDDRYGAGEAREAERLYNLSRHSLMMRKVHITIGDIKEALRAGNKLTIKS